NRPDSYVNLGTALRLQGQFSEAIAAYQQALRLNPNFAEAQNNLGNALKEQGKFSEAIAAYRQALQLNPSYVVAHSNLVFALNYSTDYAPAAIYREHQHWAASQAAALTRAMQPHDCDRDPDRRLRIGYVSGDFKSHSVAYFLEPLLAAHDHRQFEIIGYANNQKVDDTTRRLQQLADGWRHIAALNDEQAAALIRQDKVDVLVDLSGHTKGNRLRVFAQKPAPLQVTYLGYPNTTGLGTIDYRLTDAWADPEGADALHIEALVRLPHGFLCYQPWSESPDVSPSPALTAGHVTFGSFNNLAKVSPQVVAEWSAILAAVPDSRLIIKAKSLGDTGTQDYLYGLFQQHKIARDRIDLLGRIPSQAEHLALYSRVDIALDTFPYNGTTTTCESLWMGVPVITLAGPTHASRVGVSLLAAVGLSDLIATSVADYRQRAIALAGNLDQLQQLRVTMRDRMQAAPLTNASVITQSIEMAYRTMWHRFCDRARREPDFNRKGMNMLPHEPTAQGQTMDNQCLEIAQHLNQLENPKFILIRAWGHGFWSDVDHVLGQLFLAEITGRIPVVYWGANSRYRDADENAFENYFEPVSSYKIDHLIGQTYTFYPDHWTEETLK
ncbi:MAG: tetratricopeptide repeat protein, partial [Cyanobacteria bacterium J06607_6]